MTVSPFKPDVLLGKVALVTGGTSGIGFEIATQLGLHGAKIVVTGRRQEVLDAACQAMRDSSISVLGLQGDVRKQASCQGWVQEIASKLGRLDILVNCAAGNFLATAENLTPNGFRTVMEIDAIGTFTMSQAAFPLLKLSDSPSIINISATLQYGATWWQAHASAAKSAVDSLTRSLALEWGAYGIRVNGVAPGPIEGTAGLMKLGPGSAGKVQEELKTRVPLGRMGSKWDIAMACTFLASPAAGYISGDVLVVDGASWMWDPPLVPREVVSKVSRSVESQSRAEGLAKAAAARSKL